MTNYSKVYRIMHWAIAITFMFLLFTIFLRLTWLNKYNVAEIIGNFVSENEIVLSQDELIKLAKKIRQPMWIWHNYAGYVLVGLFSIRFSLTIIGEMKFQNPLSPGLSNLQIFKKWTYIAFYICVVVSLVTGLIIVWGPKSLKKSMEEIHELGTYYLVGFIVLHLAGVLMAEFTKEKGIISRIVSGSIKKK